MTRPGEPCWGWAAVDARGPSAAGRRAAAAALAAFDATLALAHDGARPIVVGPAASARGVAISISHGRHRAVAVVARAAAIGVDLCELARGPRLRALAARAFTAAERALIGDDRAAAALWAAREAGLKVLGLGLVDGGVFEPAGGCAIELATLAPPRYARPARLALQLVEHDAAIVALAVALAPAGADQTAPSTSTVAPLM